MAPLLRRWRWPWNERPWAQLDVDERGIEGGYIASVGNALKATNFAVEGSTKCQSGGFDEKYTCIASAPCLLTQP